MNNYTSMVPYYSGLVCTCGTQVDFWPTERVSTCWVLLNLQDGERRERANSIRPKDARAESGILVAARVAVTTLSPDPGFQILLRLSHARRCRPLATAFSTFVSGSACGSLRGRRGRHHLIRPWFISETWYERIEINKKIVWLWECSGVMFRPEIKYEVACNWTNCEFRQCVRLISIQLYVFPALT